MKTQLEPEDIQVLVSSIIEGLKPLLSNNLDQHDNIILDVPHLCKYLNVSKKWVHERTHLKEIPYYKLSNKQLRFRKKDIDKWLDSLKTPVINDHRGKLKAIK